MITVFKFSFVMRYTNSYHSIKWLVDDKLIIDPLRIWYQMLLGTRLLSATVEPLYSGHHWEQTFVPYNEVSLLNSVASGIFPVGVVCVIGLLSTMWLRFRASSCCTLAGKPSSITSNSASL